MVWLNRVEAYLDDLELAVDGLARQIKQMKVDQVPAPRIGSDAGRGIDGQKRQFGNRAVIVFSDRIREQGSPKRIVVTSTGRTANRSYAERETWDYQGAPGARFATEVRSDQ